MDWTATTPTESGTYRWREDATKRVHSVTVKRGARTIECKTMAVGNLSEKGEWSARAAATHDNDERNDLRELGLA